MGKRIIVVGGGHGGIAAAALLAEQGFDVTVYERNRREDMGYDWTDIFDKNGLFACGMEMPPKEKYRLKNDMTFIAPSRTAKIKQHVPEEQLEIQMERKDIYDHIIEFAEHCGVKFRFETEVKAPVMLGGRVAGIRTKDETVYADLVIDAAGINSPVRKNLPDCLGIQKETDKYDTFHVYRAFYNKTATVEGDKYRVYLLFDGKQQICWVADDEEYTDVLIGRFTPLTDEEVEETLTKLRELNDDLGTERLRGGQYVTIPVRQPLGVLVADGYAAVGDSACMTVPIKGSGIGYSIKAGVLLAKAVEEDADGLYNCDTLWKYEHSYYQEIGFDACSIAVEKNLLPYLTAKEVSDFIDSGILTAEELSELSVDKIEYIKKNNIVSTLRNKLKLLNEMPELRNKALRFITWYGREKLIEPQFPAKYDRESVIRWSEHYDGFFESIKTEKAPGVDEETE